MIIGVDIRALGSKVKSGVEEYTENLLAHMLPLDGDIKYKLFYSSLTSLQNRYSWMSLPNVELYDFRIPNKLLFLSANFLKKPYVDSLMGGVDVFFSPHFFLTSLSPSCRHVITFHDLSYVRFPEFFSLRKRLWHSLEMRPRYQSRFSDKIIAVSESTRNDLISLYQLDPARIEVIYSGISEDIKRPYDNELEEFRKKHGLPKKFILFLGKLEPRKNIPSIIRAFNILNKKHRDLNLVLIGSRGWLCKDIFKEADSSEFKDKIKFIDHVSDDDRKFYYSLASVFIYPSFFEGFGFPPLEAMTCGTPVVSSFNSSLPEIVGRNGILVDPYNINDLARAISTILGNKELADAISRQGIAQAGKFNWNNTAEKTLKAILK